MDSTKRVSKSYNAEHKNVPRSDLRELPDGSGTCFEEVGYGM